MDKVAFQRLSRANVAQAHTHALRVARLIDARCGTHLASMDQDKRLPLLRLRAVALANFVTIGRVLEVMQERYHSKKAETGLGMRVAQLTSDVALAYAGAELRKQAVQRVPVLRTSTWTAKGVADLADPEGRRAAREVERAIGPP